MYLVNIILIIVQYTDIQFCLCVLYLIPTLIFVELSTMIFMYAKKGNNLHQFV